MMFLTQSKFRAFLLNLIVFAGLLWSAPTASACRCAGGSQKGVFQRAQKQATAIFVGRAVEVTNGFTRGEFPGWRVKLKLEKYWKGQLTDEVVVFTGPSNCAAHFAVGEEYLVLAYVPDGKDHLYTSLCMQTGLVRYSRANLKRLGKSKRRPSAKHNNSLDRSPDESGCFLT